MKSRTKPTHTPGPRHKSGDDCFCEICNPQECSCRYDEVHLWIIRCPLHNAAPDLLKALKLALREAEQMPSGSRFEISEGIFRSIIAKAERAA